MVRLHEKQTKPKASHDQHATDLPTLVPGQKVTVENPRTHMWEPEVIQEKLNNIPRSYVNTNRGRTTLKPVADT